MSTRNTMKQLASAATIALLGSTATAATIDLGFSIDGSGSVGRTNFTTTANALADALGQIPTSGDNEYRVAVTAFSNSSNTVVAPVLVTAASIGGIQDSVRNAIYPGGGTGTSTAITALTDLFIAANIGDITLLNITTDGDPNSQTASEAAATAAFANGVDGISFEAIGSGISSQTALENMARIAGPGTGVIVTDLAAIPDATQTGFVIPVADFEGYSAAIEAKIGQIVVNTGGGGGGGTTPPVSAVPLPASLPMLLAGLAVVGALGRRSFTV